MAATAELVEQLMNPNGWHRQTAQRLLLERQDHAAVALLKELAGKSQNPLTQIHALWMLEGLSALDADLVVQALKDPDARVREHALRLAEAFLSGSKPVTEAVLALRRDAEPRVQFQLAFTLGQVKDSRALEVLAEIARARPDDPWLPTAVLSSAADAASPFLHLLLSQRFEHPRFLRQLSSMIGARHDTTELVRFFSAVPARTTSAGWSAALSGLTHGLKLSQARRLKVPAAESALAAAMRSPTPELQQAAWEAARYFDLPALIQQAAKDALSASLPAGRRTTAVLALRGGQFSEVSPVIGKILDAHPSAELQAASIEALSAFDDPSVGPLLLSHWKSFSPEGRKKTVVALLARRDRVPLLLKAIQRNEVEVSALDPAERSRLIGDPDGAIAKQARQLLHTDSSERAKVVTAYRNALTLEGNVPHGKKVFDDNCAKCHMPRKMGGRVGPDLSGINNKTKEELLTSILNPSYAIEPRFVNYMVTTKQGQMYDGVIVNETPGAVTLRGGSEEGDQTILRSHIADIRASSISLMPEGLEDSMTKHDISDVIAYLRGGL